MDKGDEARIYNGDSFSQDRGGDPAICNNVDAFEDIIFSEMSHTEEDSVWHHLDAVKSNSPEKQEKHTCQGLPGLGK